MMGKEGHDKEHSIAFKQFYDEFFGRSPYMQWHDGIDARVVQRLTGAERDEAENMLIASLLRGDMFPSKGLAALGSVKALPHLEARLQVALDGEKVLIADAIESIAGKGECIPELLRILRQSPAWSDRMSSAIVLRRYKREDVINALLAGVQDPDFLVRNHSAESLLAMHGLDDQISHHPAIFSLICTDKQMDGVTPAEQHCKAKDALKSLLHAAHVEHRPEG